MGLSTLETCGVYNIANVLFCDGWDVVHKSPLLYADLLLYGVMVTQMWVDCSFLADTGKGASFVHLLLNLLLLIE